MALIPAELLIDWTPGTATGVPGGIPGYADGPAARTMYVNAITGALGGGGTYGGTLAEGDGITDDTAALQAMIDTCPGGEYVYLPAADYRLVGALRINPSIGYGDDDISIKGDGDTTLLLSEASTAIVVGPSAGFILIGSAADFVVSAGLSKGSTSLTIGSTANLTANQLVQLQVDLDEDLPDVSVNGYQYLRKQVVRVVSITNGTQFTFAPALYSDYGSGSWDARIRAVAYQIEGVGIEDLKIDMTNAPSGQEAVAFYQAYGCWAKGVRGTEVVNYGIALRACLQCEVRHCVIDPRNSSGTSGAPYYIDLSSGILLEDTISIGDWVNSGIVDNGSSGNVISRNYAETSGPFDMNHGAGVSHNIAESNAFTVIITDGYFGSDYAPVAYNNYAAGFSQHRFTRDGVMVGNYFDSNSYAGGADDVTGLPNFGNTSYSGTSTYYSGDYSDPWEDYQITGERETYTTGTASGYVVNNGGGYSVGDTSINLGTGSGTFVLGDKVSFAGSSYTYWVQSFSGTTLVINEGEHNSGLPGYGGSPGLIEAIADGAAVTKIAMTPSTGTGYVINNGGGYSAGTTSLTIGSGSGTINPGDVVTFSGDANRYAVVSYSAPTLTIGLCSSGGTGLAGSISDGATVTISQDRGLISYTSPGGASIRSFNGFYPIYPVLNWGDSDTNQRYRVPVATSTHIVVINDQDAPNGRALPAIGTPIIAIGPGSEAFQEKDLAVELTTVRKGNRYLDGTFDSLGGDPLPSSLIYGETRPAWLDVDEAEYPGSSFELMPFDPVGGIPPSNSDIPAGFRFFYLIDPEFVSAGINSSGNELSLTFNKPVQIGAGGSGGATASGGIDLTFDRITGSTVVYTTSRIISEGEVVTVSYANPGNGIEAVSNGNDVPDINEADVSNASSVTTGVVHYGPDEVDMTSDYPYPDSGTIVFSKATVEGNGNAIAIRWYTAVNDFDAPCRVILCEMDGTKLSSSTSNGTVSGFDRWQSMTITSTPVTNDTDYLVGVQFLGNGDPTLRKLDAQGANSSYYADGHPFGSALPSTVTGLVGATHQVAIQVRVVLTAETFFDGSGSTTFTGAGTVTFG